MRYTKMNSFIVMDIVRNAQKYSDSIHFEIGQPDLHPSQKIKESLKNSIDDNHFAYTESIGLLDLRVKIQEHYKKTYGVDVDENQILLTPGTSGAFLVAYTLSLKHHDILGLSDPSYPCYKNFAYMLDIKPKFIKIDKSTNYELTKELIKNKKMNALQISSPSNPVGNIYGRDNFKELVKHCEQNSITFISDELYHGLNYDKKVHSALEFGENTIVINGFSKYYCLPGLRLGWIVVPKNLTRQAEIIAQNIFISAPTLSQYGALSAFDDEFLSGVRETFKQRRDFLYKELSDIFTIDVKPQGAFYIWANISNYTNNSFNFAKELLEKTHVATTPGIDFGANNTNLYLRFAYTREIKHMQEGVSRIKEFLKAK